MAGDCSDSGSASFETSPVDIEQLIEAVRSRPALWDPNAENYTHRATKRKEWNAIGRVFYADFDEKNDSEKIQISKELQLKWKSTRDGFVRYLRAEESRKAGDPTKSFKKYVHSKQMTFLEGIISHSTDCFVNDSVFDTFSNPRLRNTLNFINVKKNTRAKVTSLYGRKRKQFNENVGGFIDVLSKRTQENISRHNSDDLNFFLSLMPSLRTLSNSEKLMFRGDVLRLLLRYTTQGQNVVEVHPMTVNEFQYDPLETSDCHLPMSSTGINFQNYQRKHSTPGYMPMQEASHSKQSSAEFQPSSSQALVEATDTGSSQQSERKRKHFTETVTSGGNEVSQDNFIVIKQELGGSSPTRGVKSEEVHN